MRIRRREMAKGRTLRRFAVAIAGFSVLIFGVALLVVPLPGTSVVVFPFGLAILAREFKWAQRLLDWSVSTVKRAWAGVRRLFGARSAGALARPRTAT